MEQHDGMAASAAPDTIELRVPPRPSYARLVRMSAATVAAIGGLSVDDVDDVRMAAEEAFVYACATGVSDEMTIVFTLTPGQLEMAFELGTDHVSEDESEPSLVYAALILDAMCDECHINDGGDAHMRLVKRTGNADVL